MIDPNWNQPEDKMSAVHALEGKILKTGWKVIEKANAKAGSTGGGFSVCYIVEKDGQLGFLKALNILSFLRDDRAGLLEAMTEMLNTYKYEKEILTRCGNRNLSKISRLLEASHENFPGYMAANVYYMIFEKADSDVRNHLNYTSQIDIVWKLRSLHNIATGIKQLHSIEISHQDVKPSNIFIFDNVVSKLGDLGRSLCQTLSSPHSELNFAGDNKYAPPEVFHRFILPEWKDKVFAIDCYLLGSMASYYFTGQSMTALLSTNLNPQINISSLDFENALPYWQVSFEASLETIRQHISGYNQNEKLIETIRMLSNPDPRKRGHPKNIHGKGNNFFLERFVEIFNLLATRAEYNLRN
jgi:eukaryotic-like serine/threonine-protein kinase